MKSVLCRPGTHSRAGSSETCTAARATRVNEACRAVLSIFPVSRQTITCYPSQAAPAPTYCSIQKLNPPATHARLKPRVFWPYDAWRSRAIKDVLPPHEQLIRLHFNGVTWPTFKRRKYNHRTTYLIHICAAYIASWNVWGRSHQHVVPVPNHQSPVTSGGSALFYNRPDLVP